MGWGYAKGPDVLSSVNVQGSAVQNPPQPYHTVNRQKKSLQSPSRSHNCGNWETSTHFPSTSLFRLLSYARWPSFLVNMLFGLLLHPAPHREQQMNKATHVCRYYTIESLFCYDEDWGGFLIERYTGTRATIWLTLKGSNHAEPHLVTGWCKGLREDEEGQRQVDETVPIGMKQSVPLYYFVQLQTHKASDSCFCRPNGWDDISSNHLALLRQEMNRNDR